MNKFLFKEIIENEKILVQCDTLEQKNILYHQADAFGLKRNSGKSYLDEPLEKEFYLYDIHYLNNFKFGMFENSLLCKKDFFRIVGFNEIEFGNEVKKTNEEKINLKMRLIIE